MLYRLLGDNARNSKTIETWCATALTINALLFLYKRIVLNVLPAEINKNKNID